MALNHLLISIFAAMNVPLMIQHMALAVTVQRAIAGLFVTLEMRHINIFENMVVCCGHRRI
jgi:hypothetical protein